MPKDSGIGASSKRREDIRFLTGTGQYTDDINVQGQAYVHFLRSSVAHGGSTVSTQALRQPCPALCAFLPVRILRVSAGFPADGR